MRRRVGAERTSVRQQWLGNQVSQSGEREGREEPDFPFVYSQCFKALSSANSPWTLLQSGSQRDWNTSTSPLFHRPATVLLPLSVWGPPWESCTHLWCSDSLYPCCFGEYISFSLWRKHAFCSLSECFCPSLAVGCAEVMLFCLVLLPLVLIYCAHPPPCQD